MPGVPTHRYFLELITVLKAAVDQAQFRLGSGQYANMVHRRGTVISLRVCVCQDETKQGGKV